MFLLLILYCLFMGTFGGWMLKTGTVEEPVLYGIVLLILFWAALHAYNFFHARAYAGILLMLLLANVGAAVASRSEESLRGLTQDLIIMAAAFAGMRLLSRIKLVYRSRIFTWLSMAGMLVALFGARFTGSKTSGSYLTFLGIQAIAFVIILYPFVAAYYLSKPERSFFQGRAVALSWNMIYLLLYTVLIYVGSIMINEQGLLLIIGVISSVAFFCNSKRLSEKVAYTVGNACVAILILLSKSHIRRRFLVAIDLASAAADPGSFPEADLPLYLINHIKETGFWGMGIGSTPVSGAFKNMTSDYCFSLLVLEYGLFIAALVVLAMVLLVMTFYKAAGGLEKYQKCFVYTSTAMIALLFLLHIGSCIGSGIQAGLPLPFISDAGSVNMALASCLGMSCGFLESERKKVQAYKDDAVGYVF